jgi:TetR/AcrR family transcriptional regulator of autoinduction and epiphytic fitness
MPQPVKGQVVKGQAGRRALKARATRRRILDAAETLFVRDGYAATAIATIAGAADVAVPTVYAVFGTKRAILAELLAARTVGDDDSAALSDRADWQSMERETDPRRQIAALASIATRVGDRIAGLYEVMAGAAGSDPEIAAIYQQRQDARYQDQRRVADLLAGRGALRAGLSPARAADAIWAIANPRTQHALVAERQWTAAEYENWLADLLTAALLAGPAHQSDRR